MRADRFCASVLSGGRCQQFTHCFPPLFMGEVQRAGAIYRGWWWDGELRPQMDADAQGWNPIGLPESMERGGGRDARSTRPPTPLSCSVEVELDPPGAADRWKRLPRSLRLPRNDKDGGESGGSGTRPYKEGKSCRTVLQPRIDADVHGWKREISAGRYGVGWAGVPPLGVKRRLPVEEVAAVGLRPSSQ